MPESIEKADGRFVKHFSTREEREQFDPEQEDEEALFDHYTLTVSSGQKPTRVDKYLSNLLPMTSRSRIKNASITGSIKVNDQEVKVSYKVRPGDVVKLMLPFPPNPKIGPEEIPLDIRYEDEAFLIVHKPPGMVMHPAVGHRTGTLVHGLLWHFDHLPAGSSSRETPRPGLVHRIDKDTTGIVVVAKTEFAMAHLSKQFFDRTSDRRYIALVWGDLAEDQGTVIANIGRNPKNRKSYFAFPEGSPEGKHAVTHYTVLERFGMATLVQCKLETGRTHQIRVHMKYIGHPLFGDTEYGGDKILKGDYGKKYQQMMRNCLQICPRQALHAKSLSVTHPDSGERMHFDSELPEDIATVIDKLRRWREGSL